MQPVWDRVDVARSNEVPPEGSNVGHVQRRSAEEFMLDTKAEAVDRRHLAISIGAEDLPVADYAAE
jgi:hypothetical protein